MTQKLSREDQLTKRVQSPDLLKRPENYLDTPQKIIDSPRDFKRGGSPESPALPPGSYNNNLTRSDSPEFELRPMSRFLKDEEGMKKVNSQAEETLIKLMDGISDIESIRNGGAPDNCVWRKSSDGPQET